MKYLGPRATAILFLVLLSLIACANETKRLATYEPFLGLTFNTDSVKFEPILQTPLVQKIFDGQQQWIFAKCKRQNDSVFVVSGWLKKWSDSKNGDTNYAIEPDFGSVIRMTENNIEILGVPDGLFVSGKYSLLPPEDTKCLMADAAKRYTSAYGGVKPLQQEINQKGGFSNELSEMLVDAFKAEGVLLSKLSRK
jgi:hypothetical protein